jgi:hypothetical protein
MSSRTLWHQSDRETPADQARRTIHQAEAALQALWAVFDAQLDPVAHQDAPKMFGRTLTALGAALQAAQTLVGAYDYFLARCLEAGMSPADAAAAWDMHSSEAFEAEIVEAEAVGPNALRMIDDRLLARLGIAPQRGTNHA